MTPAYKAALKELKLDAGYGIDFETYWAADYTLSKLATTDYVYDARFETQLVAVQKDTWKQPRVMEARAFRTWAAGINWARAGMLGHHTHFDGLILHRHFKIEPAVYFDTLSMARPCMPVTVPRGLDPLAKALGFAGKVHGGALQQVKGLRWKDVPKPLKAELKLYAGDDISDTWGIFLKLLEYFTVDELRLINDTIGMYAKPRLLLDKDMVEGLVVAEVERKRKQVEDLNTTFGDLQSNDRFAELLEALGIDPPMKWSDKQQKLTWAFSKQDHDFKALLEHEDETVAALVQARLDVKSTMVETRARRLANRADYGAQPIYLNYWGAGPGRWSGGDKANWQNLKRGSLLRNAIMAPPGQSLVIADLSQIEARINAYTAGEAKKLDVFRAYDTITGWKTNDKGERVPIRAGPDVYRVTASDIFNMSVEQIDALLRFLGKTADLGLGYGAGAPRFGSMIRLADIRDPEILAYIRQMTDSYIRDIHSAWRQTNARIVQSWKQTENLYKSAVFGCQHIEHGVVSYEGARGKGVLNGFMHMPNGTALRYDRVEQAESGVRYLKKYRINKTKPPTEGYGKLYGGLLVENRTQALARVVVAEHALNIADELKYWKLSMTTHDELVGLVPTRYAQRALKVVEKVMSTPPAWAPDLPVAVEAHISQRYDK
ncbi:MAG TPA: DNA polymerase [Rhodocyclaceae bacterium]|nr:DNA polymerase [Rhodocyclaceae bacterium]